MGNVIHEGHRERLKRRFIKQDLDAFEEINALELILFFGIARKDTNLLAHKLLDRFGSFANVLEASYEELVGVDGIGENSATLIKLFNSVNRYYSCRKDDMSNIIVGLKAAGEFAVPLFIGMVDEIVYVICLDNKGKVGLVQKLSEGTKDSATVSARKIAEIALRNNAHKIIIAHNHPGGLALPSQDDITTTAEIEKALSIFNIKLMDHIVVADADYVSLAQSGLIGAQR